MPRKSIDEQSILKELRQIPQQHWGKILAFLRSLQPGKEPSATEQPILSGADLAGSDLIGIWADGTDIVDSQEFARQLRQ